MGTVPRPVSAVSGRRRIVRNSCSANSLPSTPLDCRIPQLRKRSCNDRFADSLHQLERVCEVVDGQQPRPDELLGRKQMADVAAAVPRAHLAAARRVERVVDEDGPVVLGTIDRDSLLGLVARKREGK